MKKPIFRIHDLSGNEPVVTDRFQVSELDKQDRKWWDTMCDEGLNVVTVGQTIFEIPVSSKGIAIINQSNKG